MTTDQEDRPCGCPFYGHEPFCDVGRYEREQKAQRLLDALRQIATLPVINAGCQAAQDIALSALREAAETPVERAIQILKDAAEGLEDAVFYAEAESSRYDNGCDLIIGVKGFRMPTPEERVKIQKAREYTKERDKIAQQSQEARDKAEYERLSKKFGVKG